MANTNLMSINLNQAAVSTGSSGSNSKYTSSSRGNGSDFNSALGRATNTINRQSASTHQNPANAEDVQKSDTNTQNPDAPVEQKEVAQNTSIQGKNTQPQDAPQNVTQNQAAAANVPAEVDAKTVLPNEEVQTQNIAANTEIQPENISVNVEVNFENIVSNTEINPQNTFVNVEVNPENVVQNTEIKTNENEIPEINPDVSYVFAGNVESLLQPQIAQNNDEVNLMTIIPQNDNNKAQSMLDVLSGKTWTAEDVKATVTPQNSNTAEVNQSALQVNQNQNANNFTLNPNPQNENPQPQIFTRQANLAPAPQMNLNAEQQPQLQQLNLNNEQQPQIQGQSANLQQPQIQTQLNADQPLQAQSQNQSQVQTQQQVNTTQAPLQQTLQTQTAMQEQPILNSLQPQFEPKQVNQQNQLTELLGTSVQIETTQNSLPLSPIQPLLRQQPEQNNQQSANQNFQQSLSQELNPEVQSQQQNIGGVESFAQNLNPAVDNVTNNQTVTQTQNPEAAAQAARDNESIPAQIVQQARMIRTAENTEMVINLKPEHLGQLTLRISVSQNGAVNASFYSDNVQVRVAIENSIVQLKQELNDQGLKVENVQVYAGLSDGGLTNGQGGQAWQNQQQNSNGRKIDFSTIQDEIEDINPTNNIENADGVDYKI